MFELDQVGAILGTAETIIQAERENWSFVYQTVEEYVAAQTQFDIDQGIFIGGSTGVDLLLGKPRTLSDYTYHLYSRHALTHVNELTNRLAEVTGKRLGAIPELLDKARSAYKAEETGDRGAQKLTSALADPKIVVMKTSLPYQRYLILIDSRQIVQMTSLPKGSAAIVKPALVPGFGGNKVYVISPEVQLLDLYRTLYSPAKAAEWKTALHDEINLYQHLKQRLDSLKAGDDIVGGKDRAQSSAQKLVLLSNWVVNGPMILIGEYGIQLALGQFSDDQRAMLQVIVDQPLEETMNQAKTIVLKAFPSAKCTYSIKPLVVMQDFRLQRAALRVDDHEVLYAYNCGAYDLVPFNMAIRGSAGAKGGVIRVGNPFVLLRFLLVDFWTVRLLASEGHIDQNYARLRLDSIVRQLLLLRSKISEMDEKSQTMSVGDKFLRQGGLLRIFAADPDSYMGTYEDEIQAQKNELKKGARRFGDYYPDEHKIRTGAYRQLNPEGGYDIPEDSEMIDVEL